MNDVINFLAPRIDNLITLPIKWGNVAVDAHTTVLGVAATVLSVFSLGLSEKVNDYSYKVNRSYTLLPNLYLSVIQIINPNVEGGAQHLAPPKLDTDAKPHIERTGYLYTHFAQWIYVAAKESARDHSFWSKHIVSRAAYAVGALAATITRIGDFALAKIFVILSFATLGCVPKINEYAVAQLTSLGWLADISQSARGFINPFQFKEFKPVPVAV